MAIQLQPTEKNPYTIVQAIIQLVTGRHNAGGICTLTPNATSTVVSQPNCSKDCFPQITPMTANAAAALTTTYVSAVGQGSFTLTHANNAQTDRKFYFTCTGG